MKKYIEYSFFLINTMNTIKKNNRNLQVLKKKRKSHQTLGGWKLKPIIEIFRFSCSWCTSQLSLQPHGQPAISEMELSLWQDGTASIATAVLLLSWKPTLKILAERAGQLPDWSPYFWASRSFFFCSLNWTNNIYSLESLLPCAISKIQAHIQNPRRKIYPMVSQLPIVSWKKNSIEFL